MSHSQRSVISCPACSAKGEAIFTTFLEAPLDPETRETLARLDELICDGCGETLCPVHDLLYHDPEAGFAVFLRPPEDAPCFVEATLPDEAVAGAEAGAKRLRKVSTLGELVEKISIFEDGLDDRVVEAVKLIAALEEEKDGPLLYLEVSESLVRGREVIFVRPSGGATPVSVSWEEGYLRVEKMMEDGGYLDGEGEWLTVGAEYAAGVLSGLFGVEEGEGEDGGEDGG